METILKKILFTLFFVAAAISSGVQAMSPEEIADQVAEVAGQVLSEETPKTVIQAALAKVAALVVTTPIRVLEEATTTVMTAVATEEPGEIALVQVAQAAQTEFGEIVKSVGNKVGALLAVAAAPVTVAVIRKLIW